MLMSVEVATSRGVTLVLPAVSRLLLLACACFATRTLYVEQVLQGSGQRMKACSLC